MPLFLSRKRGSIPGLSSAITGSFDSVQSMHTNEGPHTPSVTSTFSKTSRFMKRRAFSASPKSRPPPSPTKSSVKHSSKSRLVASKAISSSSLPSSPAAKAMSVEIRNPHGSSIPPKSPVASFRKNSPRRLWGSESSQESLSSSPGKKRRGFLRSPLSRKHPAEENSSGFKSMDLSISNVTDGTTSTQGQDSVEKRLQTSPTRHATDPKRQQAWIKEVVNAVRASRSIGKSESWNQSVGDDDSIIKEDSVVSEASDDRRPISDEASVASLELLFHWLTCNMDAVHLQERQKRLADPRGMIISTEAQARGSRK